MGRAIVNKQKSAKPKKRDLVMPFGDEHNFIVPKKGGFAQFDNENYVMVAGTNPIVVSDLPTDSPASTTVTTSNVPPIGIITPPVVDAPPVTPPLVDTPVTPPLISDEQVQAQANCVASGGAWINGACVVSTQPPHSPVSEMPSFPDFSAMDCAALGVQISSIQSTVATGFFTTEVANAYNNALASANSLFTSRCHSAPPNPVTPLVPVIPVVPIGGGFMGGGGGGIGEPPIETINQETKKPNNTKTLLVVLGLVGLIYFLTKK